MADIYSILRRNFSGFLFLITAAPVAFAQSPYFQQEVNCRIHVTLNDQEHTLTGEIDIEYINRSPDTLAFIYFHLWPNAYRDQASAFARQKLRTGSTRFYFSDDTEKGNIRDLNFQVDGAVAPLVYEAPDIARLILPKPLGPGQKAAIQTPFTLRIPASFSRLGHDDQSYQITQWYPKPAVYDREGWHPMPYLDMGEFYSEFGRYEVSLTLPENYVVGATGQLQDVAEINFLSQKAASDAQYLAGLAAEPAKSEQDTFPVSSPATKTLRYLAENVHDFAWFADKRFRVAKSSVVLPSGRGVDTWVMFTKAEEHLWKDAIHYVDRAVQFYSGLVGEYPYPHATAVQSALGAGGGMEYPMITVIGLMGNARSLDGVITHEVGHNWFYGILAFNERDHVWMDEGLNSYYDHRYTETYYGSVDMELLPDFLRGQSAMTVPELGYLYQARRRQDQAPETPSDDFEPLNYWLGGYEKPARAFKMLEKYLGPERFDPIMQDFYRQWQFKHPQPADLRLHLETQSGKSLDWLFDGLLYSNRQIDYALTGVKPAATGWEVRVRNLGEIPAPFPVAVASPSEVGPPQWVEGFAGEKTITLTGEQASVIVADPERWTLDVNRKNNRIKTNGLLRRTPPLRFTFLGTLEDDRKTEVYYLPFYGWNVYDKSMVGFVLHNRTLPYRKWEFAIHPMYGLGSNSLLGMGNLTRHFFPKSGWMESLDIDLTARRFHFDRNELFDYRLDYLRLEPRITVRIRNQHTDQFSVAARFRAIILGVENPVFDQDGAFQGPDREWTTIYEAAFSGRGNNPLSPFTLELALEQQSYTDVFSRSQNYLKASLEWKSKLAYRHKKYLHLRFFGGGFLQNSRRNAGAIFPGAFNLISQGHNDYRFDDFYFGRTENDGFGTQQVSLRDGGFKTPTGPGFSLGRSNNFILALNFKADLPGKIPVRPYFDFGYFDNAMPTGADDTFRDQMIWSGGLALELLDGRFGIYFPVISSKNLDDPLSEKGNYFQRIGIRVELYRMTPRGVVEGVLLGL